MQITFPTLLTLLFIYLKLTGQVAWSWVLVLAPIWICIVIFVIVAVLAILVAYYQSTTRYKKR